VHCKSLPFTVKCIYNDGSSFFPVIDTRLKLGMKGHGTDKESCILVDKFPVPNNKYVKVGFLMDEYIDTFSVSVDKINKVVNEFDQIVKGMCLINNKKHFILRLRDMFSNNELYKYKAYQESIYQASHIPVFSAAGSL
jgi:chemotaxis signal transduction protein